MLLSGQIRGCKYFVKGEEINSIDETTYLGQKIAFQDGWAEEISIRISKAWRSFWSMKAIYKSKLNKTEVINFGNLHLSSTN